MNASDFPARAFCQRDGRRELGARRSGRESAASRLCDAATLAQKRNPIYSIPMSVQELESAVSRLSTSELVAFTAWFEEFVATAWDKQLEADVRDGKLDHLAKQADEQFEAGRCTPL